MFPQFDSSEIAAATGGTVVRPGPSGPITANNQTLAPGEWFAALAGPGFDDHAFLPEAAHRGAAGLIAERLPEGLDVPAVIVDDTWRALRRLGHAARSRFDGPVVALTGSTGKTTTRVLTALALSPLGEVHQTPENTNCEPGVALALLTCPDRAAAQVIELGALRPGGIDRLTRSVDPDVRLVVNIGPAHLEHLGDLDGVAREKSALYASARPGDVCVVNADDARARALPLPAGTRRVTFGAGGDVELLDARLHADTLETTAVWRTPEGEVSARLPTPARFVATDAAAALAVAWSLGVDLAEAAAALPRYTPVGRRLRTVRVAPGATVFDDSFNANPQSVAGALGLIASLPGRRAAVLGDMYELGPDEASYHSEITELAAGLGLELLVLVGPRMGAAADGVDAVLVDDPAGAVAVLQGWLQRGDRVLVKGSRASRVDQVAAGLAPEVPGPPVG